ncbi:MAG: sortase [Dehalococcoidia bacterium]
MRASAAAFRSRRTYQLSGYSLILVGLLLLGAAGGYLVFVQVAKAGLDEQNVSVPLRQPEFPQSFERIDPERLAAAGAAPRPQEGAQWRVPTPDEYMPVDWAQLPKTVGVLPQATRISIPEIGISSTMVELDTVWEDGKLVWERPVNAVGHHLGTPNPGEAGNVVMSGHRSSPIRGEGAVFRRLGEVPGLLRESEASVDIFLYTPETIYVYRTVSTRVVEPEQGDVFRQTAEPTLTLITCTPDLVYSHRLIVTALLVATVPL